MCLSTNEKIKLLNEQISCYCCAKLGSPKRNPCFLVLGPKFQDLGPKIRALRMSWAFEVFLILIILNTKKNKNKNDENTRRLKMVPLLGMIKDLQPGNQRLLTVRSEGTRCQQIQNKNESYLQEVVFHDKEVLSKNLIYIYFTL